jgi:hypothetical protein
MAGHGAAGPGHAVNIVEMPSRPTPSVSRSTVATAKRVIHSGRPLGKGSVMVAKPKVWIQFLLVLIVLCALIALSRRLPEMDFALALALKGLLIVASVMLLWRIWRRGGASTGNGWLSLLPRRAQRWVLGETDEREGR